MKTLYGLLWLCLTACQATPPDAPDELGVSIASPAYLVLAQSTLLAQVEADSAVLTQLLAGPVRFCLPGTDTSGRGRQKRAGNTGSTGRAS